MKLFSTLCLAALMGICSLSANAASKDDLKARFQQKAMKRVGTQQNFKMPELLWAADDSQRQDALMQPRRAKQSTKGLNNVAGWGYIKGPDGNYWLYTQKSEYSSDFYTKSVITLYDENYSKKGEITIKVPSGKKVNRIEPYGTITKKFFDRDESTQEVLIYVHEVGDASDNYTGAHKIYAYNTKGALVQEFDGDTGVQFECNKNDWTTYERFILVRDVMKDGISQSEIQVYKPAGWNSSNAEVDHTFYLDNRLWNYSEGPYVNTYNIDSEPYYTISYYEKEYDTNQDNHTGDFEIIPAEDNSYIVDIYDRNYKLVKTVKVPIEKSDDYPYRFASMGMFSSEDLSIGDFTKDDDFNVVISFSDYVAASDGNLYTYEVYNGSSKKVKTICKGVNVFQQLADIHGEERQYLFMKTTEDGEYLDIINVPSCKKELTIPATIGNDIISTNMNRYAKDGSYQYVISLLTPDQNTSTGEVYGQIGWYTRKLKTDHIVKFPLTKNGLYMSPLLTGVSLNPYLFDTDEGHEYIYLANMYKSDTADEVMTVLRVADADGSTLHEYTADATKGEIRTVSLVNDKSSNPTLSIAYYNDNKGEFNMEFVSLPFEKFARGGKGTESDPYKVSTLGDLMLIDRDPSAHYLQVADINMNNYNEAWQPLKALSGSYDGGGNKILNMVVDGTKNYYAGLFEGLESESKVEGITFKDPVINVSVDNGFAGFLAGYAINANISDVHVEGYPEIDTYEEDKPETFIGGIVASASLNTNISLCSVDNILVQVPSASTVGGIAGESKTSTMIDACYVKGEFTVASTLGGIVGSTGKGAEIHNCYVDANLAADNTIGGIVGEQIDRGRVSNNIVKGNIVASSPSRVYGFMVGGISGSLSADWSTVVNGAMVDSAKVKDKVIVGNYVDLENIYLENGAEKDMKSVNLIAGHTIENETHDGYPNLKLTELALDSNYFHSSVKVNKAAVASSNPTCVNGASIEDKELTSAFFQEIGYKYGETAQKPWMGNGVPQLYYKYVEPTTPPSGIDNAVVAQGAISVAQGVISAGDAQRIELYALDGRKMAEVEKATLSVPALSRGFYVVVATDANGQKTTKKIAVE